MGSRYYTILYCQTFPHLHYSPPCLSAASFYTPQWKVIFPSLAEFVRVLESLGSDRWWWLRVFTVDVLIHQGRLTEAYQELTHTLATLDRNPSHHAPLPLATTLLTTHLKLASVHYALNNLSVSMPDFITVQYCKSYHFYPHHQPKM